jgi:hypothetical protein
VAWQGISGVHRDSQRKCIGAYRAQSIDLGLSIRVSAACGVKV